MTIAAVLFAVAALGGVALAAMRFGGRELPPMALALVHGLFAASGLVALILAVVNSNASTLAWVALVGFVVAALGGFMLFSYHLRRQALPVNYVVIHGAGAVISFVILLAAIFNLGA
ncbi:MAG TPA: hypothetical protein VFS10_21560 [Pyrinomonadaceae bacterium]|nr:hypothetical protein [Pyrinomonadaceae bacterium]